MPSAQRMNESTPVRKNPGLTTEHDRRTAKNPMQSYSVHKTMNFIDLINIPGKLFGGISRIFLITQYHEIAFTKIFQHISRPLGPDLPRKLACNRPL